MNSNVKINFEWPGLSISDLTPFTQGLGSLTELSTGVVWKIPLNDSDSPVELRVRYSALPLIESSDAIYVRKIEDVGYLADVFRNGGLQKLICARDTESIIRPIEDRLTLMRERLGQDKEVYVFAAFRNAVKCVQYCQQLGIEILGFIDNDVNKHGKDYLGYRVFPLSEVSEKSIIINASGRYCVEINEQLRLAGYQDRIDMMEFLFLYDLPFQAEQRGFRKYVTDVFDNRLHYITMYLMLADNQSRSVLNGLFLFRMTLDSSILKTISSPYHEEFFAPDILSFSKGEVFVDGGAFDGDSHKKFAKMCPDFSKAYLFEPDKEFYCLAKNGMADDLRVKVYNSGLWSTTGELRFSSTGGMDGSICEDGDIRIHVVAMDEFIEGTISHLKLDVEGAEEEALMGGGCLISQSRPKMAIALYHRAEDLWKIPVLIEKLGGQYQYSIRHYSETIDDSIIYALPYK